MKAMKLMKQWIWAGVVGVIVGFVSVVGVLQSDILFGDIWYDFIDSGLYIPQTVEVDGKDQVRVWEGVKLTSDNILRDGELFVFMRATPKAGTEVTAMAGILTYNPEHVQVAEGNPYYVRSSSYVVDSDVSTVVVDEDGEETGEIFFLVEKQTGEIVAGEELMAVKFIPQEGVTRMSLELEVARFLGFDEDYVEEGTSYSALETPGIVKRPLVITIEEERVERSEEQLNTGRRVTEDFFDGAERRIRTEIWEYNLAGQVLLHTIRYPDGTVVHEAPGDGVPPADDSEEIRLVSPDGYFEFFGPRDHAPLGTVFILREVPFEGAYAATNFVPYTDVAYEVLAIVPGSNQVVMEMLESFDIVVHLNQVVPEEDFERGGLYVHRGTWQELEGVEKEARPAVADMEVQVVKLGVFAPGGPLQPAASTSGDTSGATSSTVGGLLTGLIAGTSDGTIDGSSDATSTGASDGSATGAGDGSTGASTSGDTTTGTTDSTSGTSAGSTTGSTDGSLGGNDCNPAEPFTDIEGHWGESYIEEARILCIVEGRRPGIFEPDSPISRAEVTKLVIVAFQVAAKEAVLPFSDVEASAWYVPYLQTAFAEEMIEGYPDGSFRPGQTIMRVEALKIVQEGAVDRGTALSNLSIDQRFSAWKALNPSFTYVYFPDVSILEWFAKYVYTGVEDLDLEGFVKDDVRIFDPGASITRAEAVKLFMTLRRKIF